MDKTVRAIVFAATLAGGFGARAAVRTRKSYAPLAAFELSISREARFSLAHGEDELSRVQSNADGHLLTQLVGRDHDLHMYAVQIAARSNAVPSVAEVIGVQPARMMPVNRDAVYPALTPWVTVDLASSAGGSVERSKAWKLRRPRTESQRITLAVGRRSILDRFGRWVERPVRVQRALERRGMGIATGIQLSPAGDDGRFRRLRVVRDGATGVFELFAKHGEILGFTVDGDTLNVLASNGRAYAFAIETTGPVLNFKASGSRTEPPRRYLAQYRHLNAVQEMVLVEDGEFTDECDAALIDEVTSSETASD